MYLRTLLVYITRNGEAHLFKAIDDYLIEIQKPDPVNQRRFLVLLNLLNHLNIVVPDHKPDHFGLWNNCGRLAFYHGQDKLSA